MVCWKVKYIRRREEHLIRFFEGDMTVPFSFEMTDKRAENGHWPFNQGVVGSNPIGLIRLMRKNEIR